MNKKTDWHFARPELAESYLNIFSLGLTSARGLFARRRMGKTEFLKEDLIPAAKKQNYNIVYVNLWELEIDPATALVSEFYRAVEPTGFDKIWNKLKLPVSKLRASGKIPYLGEASVEIDSNEQKKITGTLLMEAMHVFDKTDFSLLFIIDEAQVLAYEENSHFAHALRAALDIRKDRIKVLFAGSSENTLRKMFGVPSEPFYNWAPLEAFDLLGSEFVKSMVDHVNNISKFPLSFDEAFYAFEQLKNTPEFFRRYIEYYLIHPMKGSDEALKITKEKVFNDKNFKNQWGTLLPADKIILFMIANGETDLHGKSILQKLSMALGVDEGINKNTTHNALRRLANKNIITKIKYGIYQFEDEAFSDWVKYQDHD